ncbi:MAG TPA: hypothetical protein VG986_10630 [Pseudolabrys sp.]|nr:hypothetical protein [Pseudolabrys sp.]
MSGDPHWNYAQARMQARHGDRLQEADWHALAAVQTADSYVERARATSLRRFSEPVTAGMNSHAIERALRGAWRAYVEEVASWLPTAWRPAVMWTAVLPDLPVIDALLKGETPAWTRQDPQLAMFAETDATQRLANLQRSTLAPLLPDADGTPTLGLRWARHWRALWPKQSAADARALNALARAVEAHIERLANAGSHESSATHRRALERSVTRLFRRHPASPAAVFSHLVLVALDLERLRGGIVRRRLFEPTQRRQAA